MEWPRAVSVSSFGDGSAWCVAAAGSRRFEIPKTTVFEVVPPGVDVPLNSVEPVTQDVLMTSVACPGSTNLAVLKGGFESPFLRAASMAA